MFYGEVWKTLMIGREGRSRKIEKPMSAGRRSRVRDFNPANTSFARPKKGRVCETDARRLHVRMRGLRRQVQRDQSRSTVGY
jgi:hypothetical protein